MFLLETAILNRVTNWRFDRQNGKSACGVLMQQACVAAWRINPWTEYVKLSEAVLGLTLTCTTFS